MNEFYEIKEVENKWIVSPLQSTKYWIEYPIKCKTESDANRVALVLSAQDLITKGIREALKKVVIENNRKMGAWRSE